MVDRVSTAPAMLMMNKDGEYKNSRQNFYSHVTITDYAL